MKPQDSIDLSAAHIHDFANPAQRIEVDFASSRSLMSLSAAVVGSKCGWHASEELRRRLALAVVQGFVRSVPTNGEREVNGDCDI